MTNLIAHIVITLTLATNWTGHVVGTNELGYIVTNHVATITYQDVKHEFVLTNTLSDKAVWRQAQSNFMCLTNSYPLQLWFTNILMTNNLKGL